MRAGGKELTSRDWLGGLALIIAVITAYQPVWRAGYIWDDDALLTANPCIVGPLGLKEIWTTAAANICPLTLTTFWIEHKLWGLDPLPYHLVNVLLHGANAVLLWRVLRILRVPGAWLGAALWAVHPVEVESVAWVVEMKNTESGFFFLLSILFFIKGLRAGRLDGWNYAWTLLFGAMAMAAKSSTIILPIVLCLCAWWMEGRWHWRNAIRVLPLFLIAMAAGALSLWTQSLAGANDVHSLGTWRERAAIAGYAIWFYLEKLVWPYPLITIYPGWEIQAWTAFLPFLAVIGLWIIFWSKRASWGRPCFFAFSYFLVALLPVLGFVNNSLFRFSPVFDHLQYLASMGPLALIGAGLFRFLKNPGGRCAAGLALLMILGTLSWERCRGYENQLMLWSDTLAKNPNCWAAHNNLGNYYVLQRQTDRAIVEYQKTLAINPHDDEAHYNLGLAYFRTRQTDEAIEEYEAALRINPHSAKTHYNLGVALCESGQLDDGIAQFRKAIEIAPDYAQAHNNLGIALLDKGNRDDAIVEFQKDLELNPADTKARYNLGIALLQRGRAEEAIAEFKKELEITPADAQAHNILGEIFLQNHRLAEASAQFQEALLITPGNIEIQKNLTKARNLATQESDPK